MDVSWASSTLAERLPELHETIGFRARATLDDSPEAQALVTRAVSRAKQGDPDAIRFLYAFYANNVFGFVRSMIHDDHEAEDLTQQVFAKLMTAIGKYDDRGLPFFAWLIRLVRNLVIDHLRGKREMPSDELFGAEAQSCTDLDRTHAVRAALEALPEEQRQVVLLRHLVGLTPGEIADRLGRSEGSVHGLHHRGRRALQRELALLESTPCTRGSSVRELDEAA